MYYIEYLFDYHFLYILSGFLEVHITFLSWDGMRLLSRLCVIRTTMDITSGVPPTKGPTAAGGLGKVPGFYYVQQNRENMSRLRRELRNAVSRAMGASQQTLRQMSSRAMQSTFPLAEWQAAAEGSRGYVKCFLVNALVSRAPFPRLHLGQANCQANPVTKERTVLPPKQASSTVFRPLTKSSLFSRVDGLLTK